jgi:hypothetical protein
VSYRPFPERLDPNQRDAARNRSSVGFDGQRPSHRIVNPDHEAWRAGGILAGLVARVQQYGKAEQRKILNDALIFLSAAEAGLTGFDLKPAPISNC